MTLTLATFNVKDLLEPRDEAERAILPAKIDGIAQMLRACDADVVGLQEVGPERLVRAVLDRLDGHGYAEPILGTADARGIRCALVSRLPVLASRVHTAESLPFPVFRAGDPPPFGARIPLRRGVVHAKVDAPGLGPVDVLVTHFKSARPVQARDASDRELPATNARMRSEAVVRSLVWRAAEALHVRSLVDDVLALAADARVAVVGDLNDVPGSTAVRAVQGEGAGQLFDCAARVDASARFSAMHDGRKIQIDHILASEALFPRLKEARFLNAALREHPPVRPPAGGAPGGGTHSDAAPTADSDHAPFVARFG
ncbi:MAG TPA: endonuclease/exonuclease/phosphatase family protein [Polyangiaceae bacterium]|jgi:endonuclease/exonuclease/phosphatase family metal-dependent hydrolase